MYKVVWQQHFVLLCVLIEKEQTVPLQVALIDKQTMQKAMYAWKTWKAGKSDRRAKLRRALNRILRGCLSRAFYRWRDHLAAEEKSRCQRRKVCHTPKPNLCDTKREPYNRFRSHSRFDEVFLISSELVASSCDFITMQTIILGTLQVQVTVSKGLMSRCFFEWRRLADDRWWKKQLLFREREIELLEKLCGGFRNRPFVVLRKRRLRRVLRCWLSQAVRLRRKRLRLARAVRAFRCHQMLAAWNTWIEYTDVRLLPSLSASYYLATRASCYLPLGFVVDRIP